MSAAYIGDRTEIIKSYDYAILPSGRRVMVISRTSTKNGNGILVYYSDDGMNWSVNYTDRGALTNRISATINPANGEIFSLITVTATSVTIARSTDFGATWTTGSPATIPSFTPIYTQIMFDPSVNRLLLGRPEPFVSQTNAILQSTDLGTTWSPFLTIPSTGLNTWVSFSKTYSNVAPHSIVIQRSNGGTPFTFHGVNRTTGALENGVTASTTGNFFPIDTGQGISVTYSPMANVYAWSSVNGTGYPGIGLLSGDLQTASGEAVNGLVSNESLSGVVWYPPASCFVLMTRDSGSTTVGVQARQRIAKSQTAIAGSWVYDSAPLFSTSNVDGRVAMYDSLANLIQMYVSGSIYLGNAMAYVGNQANMPTPTPTASATISATPFDTNSDVSIVGRQTSVNGTANNSYSFVNNAGSTTLSYNLGLAANENIFGTVHITGTNEQFIFGNYAKITSAGDISQCAINRIDKAGTLNNTWGVTGLSSRNITSFFKVDDNTFIFTNSNTGRVHKMDANGVVDPTWGNTLTGFSSPNAFLDTYTPTKFYLAGSTRIIRANLSDGTIDNTFTQVIPNATINSMITQSNGYVIIYGSFTTLNGVSRSYIVRVNQSGAVDPTFNVALTGGGAGVTAATNSLCQLSDGSILIGGGFTAVDGVNRTYLTKLTKDGRPDLAFNTNLGVLNSSIYGISEMADHRILISGPFTSVGGVSRSMVARLLPTGAVDTTFNTVLTAGIMYKAQEYNYPKYTITPTVTPSITPTQTPVPSAIYNTSLAFRKAVLLGG